MADKLEREAEALIDLTFSTVVVVLIFLAIMIGLDIINKRRYK